MFAKQITNQQLFNQTVSTAIESVAINASSEKEATLWLKGIDRAVEMIESQGEFMNYDLEAKELTIWSQTSDKIYVANGQCQCEAYLRGNGRCKHRIAAKLFKNYFNLDEAKASQAVAEVAANITPQPYICQLCGESSASGTEHNECHQKEQAWSDYATEMDNAFYSKTQVRSEKLGGYRL